MKVKQISIFLENRAGRLNSVVSYLGEANVNIRALSLADTSDFGILRMIVDQPERAQKVLADKEFTYSLTDVIAVEVPDKPGGLGRVLAALERDGINVEYMYAFVEKSGDAAVIIFRFEEIEKAAEILNGQGFNVLSNEEVLSL